MRRSLLHLSHARSIRRVGEIQQGDAQWQQCKDELTFKVVFGLQKQTENIRKYEGVADERETSWVLRNLVVVGGEKLRGCFSGFIRQGTSLARLPSSQRTLPTYLMH